MSQYARYPVITVTGGGFTPVSSADSMLASYPDAVTEVYAYYSGGLSGTLVQTITVVYTDATKELIHTVVKT